MNTRTIRAHPCPIERETRVKQVFMAYQSVSIRGIRVNLCTDRSKVLGDQSLYYNQAKPQIEEKQSVTLNTEHQPCLGNAIRHTAPAIQLSCGATDHRKTRPNPVDRHHLSLPGTTPV